MSVKIINCSCQTGSGSKYQDEVYGKNKRVANLNIKGEAFCTCCGTKEAR